MAKGKYKKKRMRKFRREMVLEKTNLSVRVVHILKENGFMTLADLDACSMENLMKISGIGEKAIEEICAVKWTDEMMEKYGVKGQA